MGLRRSIMGFDQEEVLKLTTIITKEVRGVKKEIELKLDMNDLLILKQIADFPNRKKITKILVDEKIFFWVSYKEIISELPILGIGKQALSDRLEKMVKLGVLEREIKTMPPYANMTLFRIGDKYERLKYKVEDSKDDSTVSNYDTVSCSTTIGCRSQIRDINNEYNNNKDDNNVDKEEIDKYISKKDEKDEVDSWVNEMYSIYPSKCPCRNTYLGKCSKDKERIRKLLKSYTKEQIEKVIRNEVDTKYGKSYMMNFSTFLNNFPDPNCIEFSVCETNLDERNNNVVIKGVEYR